MAVIGRCHILWFKNFILRLWHASLHEFTKQKQGYAQNLRRLWKNRNKVSTTEALL